jgi:hypothetical protein
VFKGTLPSRPKAHSGRSAGEEHFAFEAVAALPAPDKPAARRRTALVVAAREV